MAASGSKILPSLGFFTVTVDDAVGYVGGLLVLNAAGRPLEFHCTAPLKPNRAQEILYGPTLKPFLYGEQIGATLAAKAKSDLLFFCTDLHDAMCLRQSIPTPLVLVGSPQDADSVPEPSEGKQRWLRFDPPSPSCQDPMLALSPFQLGTRPVAVLQEFADDQTAVLSSWQPFAQHLDLWEPFTRVREALSEAQRGVGK